MSFYPTISILDSHVAFKESTDFHGTEPDIPDAIIDLLETDVLAGTDDRNIDPLGVLTDTTVGTDIPDLEAVRVFQRRDAIGHRSPGRLVA